MAKNGLAVVGIGGNSLIRDKAHLTVPDQYAVARETCRHVADMIAQGWDIALSHGNGPQVGFILRRSEIAHKVAGMHEVPLDFCGADSQGALGYTLQQNLRNEFRRRRLKRAVATVVTQVTVHVDDPAFREPSKPIGASMTKKEAQERVKKNEWAVAEDDDGRWRRVVPSPYPQRIVELDAVKTLLEAGVITITVGGGGIPVVVGEDGDLSGVEAVIDKDYASALLARRLQADLFLISTSVEKVALNYKKPGQIWMDRLTAEEARKYYHDGHFAPGSMGPKIEAALYYLKYTGNRVIITDPGNIIRALRGETGTVIEG